MAFKAQLTTLTNGIGGQTARNIATLNYLAAITPPVDEAAMRAALQAGQFQPYTDKDWQDFVMQMATVPLELASLTAAEISIVNVLYAAASPSANDSCCGVVVPISANVSYGMSPLVGSATWQHSIDIKLALDVDCNVAQIEVVLAGGPPATLPASPYIAYFSQCSDAGRHFIYLWTSYGTDPTGVTYTPTLTLKDSDGNFIATIVKPGITL